MSFGTWLAGGATSSGIVFLERKDPFIQMDFSDPNDPMIRAAVSSTLCVITVILKLMGEEDNELRESIEEYMLNLVSSLNAIGDALEDGFMRAHVEKLGMKVWDVGENFGEDVKTAAYDYLIDNRHDGMRFIGLPLAQRMKWLENFRCEMFPPPNED